MTTSWLYPEIKRHFLLGRKAMTNLDNVLQSRDITLPTKISMVTEWILLNFLKAFDASQGTLESSLDSKIKPVNPKGNQPWIFIGSTDAEAPKHWPYDIKSRLTGKDPNAGQEWGQEETGMREDEMVGWYHWLSEHKFAQTPGDSEGQGSLVCCSPWSFRVRHNLVTEQQ